MKPRVLPLFVPLVLGICGQLFAENAGQDARHYSYQTSAKFNKQSAEEVEDIGELVEKKGFNAFRDKLRFNVTAREAYTTNALLKGNHSSSDAVFLPTIEAGFHTLLGEHFSFDIATKLEAGTYAKYDQQNFAAYSAVATLDYRIKAGLPRFYASIEPYRFDSFDTGDRITQAIGFTGGTDWGISFNGGRTLGFVGYSFSDYLADPNIDTRLVNRAVIGVAHQIRSNLTGQIYYVYQHSHYTDFDRNDSKNTVAGNLIYQFSQHLFGSWTTSFVSNNSTQDNASYKTFSTTLGLTLQF